MASENSENENISVNVPIGAIAAGLVLGLAGVAYAVMMRNSEAMTRDSMTGTASEMARTSKGMLRKAALSGLIAAIENDASRKLVVAVLKAMARRG